MSLSYAHAASGVRRRARCRSRALGEPARPMRRNAARLKYRRRCVATRMNERARAHPAERGECRGRSMTRRARQGDRPRAERMRAASRASAAGLPRASRRRHLTRRRAMGADFHPFRLRDRAGRASGTQRAQPHVVNAEAQERARRGRVRRPFMLASRRRAASPSASSAGEVRARKAVSTCRPGRWASNGVEWRMPMGIAPAAQRFRPSRGHSIRTIGQPSRKRAARPSIEGRAACSSARGKCRAPVWRARIQAARARPAGRGGRRANGFAGRAPRRYPCSGARRRRAAARARAPAHSAAIVRIRPPVAYSCATRRLLRAPRSPARAIGRSRRARRRSAPRAARRRARLAARTRCSMSAAPR